MGWTSSAGTFEQPPIGAHKARLIRLIDLGTQESEYKGEKNVRRQNLFTWELPEENREDGQPFIISKFYTASLGEKANLTKDLTSWFGKAPAPTMTTDEIKALLGKGCQVIVTEKEGTGKRQVSAVVGLGKKDADSLTGDTHNPLIFFSLEDGEYDQEIFDGLPNGIQTMIMKSPEFQTILNGGETPASEKPDTNEIPF